MIYLVALPMVLSVIWMVLLILMVWSSLIMMRVMAIESIMKTYPNMNDLFTRSIYFELDNISPSLCVDCDHTITDEVKIRMNTIISRKVSIRLHLHTFLRTRNMRM